MEQRIENLEEELKLLKNQIRAVLLDIKENLANGEWQDLSSRWGYEAAERVNAPQEQQPVEPDPVPEVTQESSSASKVTVSNGEPVQQQTEPVPHLTPTEPVNLPYTAPGSGNTHIDTVNSSRSGGKTFSSGGVDRSVEVVNQPDLVTVVMLGQWLDRAIAAVGKTETEKIIEMYDITGNMPAQMKQTLLLIIDSYGHNGKSPRRNSRNSIGLTSLSLLMEMDSLLRYRNRALEAAVLSLLAERESRQKKEQESRQSQQNKDSQANKEVQTVGAIYG
jgi:hypothetical protein